jgi:restriction endonuclease S subunit
LIRKETGEYSTEYFHKEGIPNSTFYIRSTNIKGGQIELDDDDYINQNEFIKIAKENDIVTARVGSVGIFGEIRKELEGAVYSDNILCFRLPDNLIPSVYTLLFNSKLYFELIDRLAPGSVQQRLNQETLYDLIIPIIDIDVQQQIADKIQESFTLKKQSNQLLETAKRAVEIAIEENEDAATAFIKEFIK